jgi:hypothetical protein
MTHDRIQALAILVWAVVCALATIAAFGWAIWRSMQ